MMTYFIVFLGKYNKNSLKKKTHKIMSFLKKYFFHTKSITLDTHPTSVENPILQQTSDSDLQIIKEYLQLHKLTLEDLLLWSCPICLETLDNPEVFITIPFKCTHLICFSCVQTWCRKLRVRYHDDVINHIKCCLCRKPVNQFWFDSYHIYTLSDSYQNKIIRLVLPSYLSHRLPFRVMN